jgi:hypothetical protein
MAERRPKIRPLNIIPIQAQGGRAFLLRDPQRLAPQDVVLPADMVFLLGQFDGTHTVREAQVNYVRRFGTLLTSDKIEVLLQRLEEARLLDSERFQAFRAELEADFRAQPTRKTTHAGQAYEEGAGAFVLAWQPRLEVATRPKDFALDPRRPGLIAPHYDIKSAAECYAAAYKLLGETEQPDVVVILGIAHTGMTAPFALTRKPYETPFGALDTDAEIITGLSSAAPFDVFADEFLHRDEHSVEFQAVLLHFLYRGTEPPKIVPILCGAYHRKEAALVNPAEGGQAADFLKALRGVIVADSRRIAIIASADLSHIGMRFGDTGPLTQARLEMSRRHDMALLEKAQTGDADGCYRLLEQERDRYNICGFPAVYALLGIASVGEGRLLSYRQSVDPQTQSSVSFASVGLR